VTHLDHDDPPSNWDNAIPAGGDVYYRFDPDEPAGTAEAVITWHWCTRQPLDFGDVGEGCWALAHVGKHDLIAVEPLHLEPSLLWNCCNKHGWIRGGIWTDA